MASWHFIYAKRQAPVKVLEDMEVWYNTLRTFNHNRLIPTREPVNIEWVGDKDAVILPGWKQ
ncbi:hypothetical protein PTTG_28209 [Puccinia triticina 1-1 BBBD Race 1]|uniref:Uncharacterized protein n=1 Tax=Puccinia triticina (isolate 1-1 / race 1 (BBBD)) TaxID=630390 RepID=A0A180GDZ5_PUCT1|nr:hypothetical protein PTTG_28209 [Puccinia triticina 1-1 BBBD Race 1]